MPPRDLSVWMWMDACARLDEGQRLRRQFAVPTAAAARRPAWEPPVDMFETETDIWILAALPGVGPDALEIVIDTGVLVLSGERRLPAAVRRAAVWRMEIPAGRFGRRLPLPAGRYEIARRELVDGCLVIVLRKLV